MSSYKLKYNDFHTNISDSLSSILASATQSDIIIAVDDRFFKAHQLILAFSSPYFRDLFNENGGKPTMLYMRNVKHSIIMNLLVFMYTGEVQVPVEDIHLFMETAAELQIKGLTSTEPSMGEEQLEAEKIDDVTMEDKIEDVLKDKEVDVIETDAKLQEKEQEETGDGSDAIVIETLVNLEGNEKNSNVQDEQIEVDLSLVKEEPLDRYLLTFGEENESFTEENAAESTSQVNGCATQLVDVDLDNNGPSSDAVKEYYQSDSDDASEIDIEEVKQLDKKAKSQQQLKTFGARNLKLEEGEPVLVTLGYMRRRKSHHTLMIHDNFHYGRSTSSKHIWHCASKGFTSCTAKIYIIANRRIMFANAHNHRRDVTVPNRAMILEKHIFFYLPFESWKRKVDCKS